MTLDSSRGIRVPPTVITVAFIGAAIGGAAGFIAPVVGLLVAAVAAATVHGLASLASP